MDMATKILIMKTGGAIYSVVFLTGLLFQITNTLYPMTLSAFAERHPFVKQNKGMFLFLGSCAWFSIFIFATMPLAKVFGENEFINFVMMVLDLMLAGFVLLASSHYRGARWKKQKIEWEESERTIPEDICY